MGLPSPSEVLELNDGESVSFRVLGFEVDPEYRITPRHRPEGKIVRAIRVHVPPEDKQHFPFYFDLTASTLVAQIEPHLTRPDAKQLRFTLRAQGFGPKKRFQVETVAA